MTIRKLGPYGVSVPRPTKLIVLRSDSEIAQQFHSGRLSEPCTVTQGSIAQSLGIDGQHSYNDSSSALPKTLVQIDLLQIEYRTKLSKDTVERTYVAGTLSVQHHTQLSTFLLLSNSGILRGRDVLPRAHPNDGFVDVLEIDETINIRQRALAWHRSKTGSHLPHPQCKASRSVEFQWSGRSSKMIADGVTYKGVVWLKCKVLSDAMSIYF
jgi:hypothetical protein